MSDSTMTTEIGPSYSLFVEIALAVGTTLLALYFCTGNKKGEHKSEKDKNAAATDGRDKYKTENADGDIETKEKTLGPPMANSLIVEANQNTEADTHHDIDQKPMTKELDEKTTQTDDEVNDAPPDLKIMYKAMIVNAYEHLRPRFRTELHVAVDGTVTHCESFQREGIAGVGVHQMLAKVQ